MRQLLIVMIFTSALTPSLHDAEAAMPETIGVQADQAGVASGLAVVIGSTDGAAEVALADGGKRLVQGLARDAGSLQTVRSMIRAKGLFGVATAIRPDSFTTLPYADGLVNLLVIDTTQPGDLPPAEEIRRVLAPGGVLLTWRGGKWERSINPRPKQLDDWTHFDHDAAGTGESHDATVGPPTNVQWRLEIQPYRGWGGNPAGYRPYSAFRVAGGRSFCIENQADAEAAVNPDKSKAEQLFLQARVASNGLPIWKRAIVGRAVSATHLEYHLVADADRVIWLPDRDHAPVALDAASGKELFSYDIPAADIPAQLKGLPGAYYQLRLDQGMLLVHNGSAIHACDAATGKRKWSWSTDGLWPAFPRILPGGRVLVQLVKPQDGYKVEMRWPNMPTLAVACIGLGDGKEQYRVQLPTLEQIPPREGINPRGREKKKNEPPPTGPLQIGQSMLAGDLLYLFGSSGIGASTFAGQVACVDLSAKKVKWATWTGDWGYNLVLRDGLPYWFTPSTLYTVNPEDGSVSKFFDAAFNNRCNRSSTAGDWLINGMGIWVDKAGDAIVRSIARSGCAQGPTVAQGMVLYTPNVCTCITQLRGHIAVTSEAVKPAPADATRLQKDGVAPTNGPAASVVTPFDTPITSEWPLQIYSGRRETAEVKGPDGKSYVGVIHEHRLECRKDGKTLWTFTAGGRITQAPVVQGKSVLFGSHDGFAYSVDADTGALRWRFYAGGAPRQIVSHGQVESSWPVYNVILDDKGNACFTAGLHPETGGGIYAWGLDAATGAIKWKHLIARTEVKLSPEKGKIAPNRVLNSPIALEPDGKLSIIGLSFSPDETNAALRERIDTMSFKDALRNDGAWTLRGETPARK